MLHLVGLMEYSDRLGTNRIQTGTSQTTAGTQEYDAFGVLTSTTGTKNTLGFAGGFGYQEDDEAGLKLLEHRLYDPSIGRFLERDPIGSGSNWYAYCGNNPLKAVGPSGYTSRISPAGAVASAEPPEIAAGALKGANAARGLLSGGRIVVALRAIATWLAKVLVDAGASDIPREKDKERISRVLSWAKDSSLELFLLLLPRDLKLSLTNLTRTSR